MHDLLFTGLVFSTAGALCAAFGDLRKQPGLGLACMFMLNVAAWTRLITSVVIADAPLAAAAHLVLAQIAATMAYLATMHYLDSVRVSSADAALLPD